MQAQTLEGGFVTPPIDAAHAFRAIMTAMARPSEILQVAGAKPPAPMSVAAGVTVLTLCDPETPVFLAPSHDTPALRDWITFHTGAPIVNAAKAAFAVGRWEDLPLGDFQIGTAEYPDRSATLIVERDVLENSGATLRGPGIKEESQLSLPVIAHFVANAQAFPLGLDFVFTCGNALAAMPRTTRVTDGETL